MGVMISYFYQIRNLHPGMIPFSTAMWDPKWFHDNRGKDYVFYDRRFIINGLRAEELVPGPGCNGDCRGPENCNTKDPTTCDFLRHYREQLDALDFNTIVSELEVIAQSFNNQMGCREESIPVLIVYETPKNPCSERVVLKQWFLDHGVVLPEFTPDRSGKL